MCIFTLIRNIWLAALEGGRYHPATGDKLRAKGLVFSPLGVLCDLFKKSHPELNCFWTHEGYFRIANKIASNIGTVVVYGLPWTVAKWAGFDTQNPCLDSPGSNAVGVYCSTWGYIPSQIRGIKTKKMGSTRPRSISVFRARTEAPSRARENPATHSVRSRRFANIKTDGRKLSRPSYVPW